MELLNNSKKIEDVISESSVWWWVCWRLEIVVVIQVVSG